MQSLWSGYGKILRIGLEGGSLPSVIAKLISPPSQKDHPRGWNTNIGHQRKLRSYQVEENWYRNYNKETQNWRTAKFIGAVSEPSSQLIVLEDLDASGYDIRKHSVTLDEIKSCLTWLANFHATHLGRDPKGLWEEGCYWHLDTRPEELEIMRDGPLKTNASKLDEALKSCQFRTIVHGDAKLANFCFAADGRVAAVDFQYVGGGCGMKDVAYFIGSCLDENGCEQYEIEMLDHYFDSLRIAGAPDAMQFDEIEDEWRKLYPVAWADFTRFLEGWMTTHRKLHRYSRKMVELALASLS